jgi:hypothetical protein
MPRQNGSSKPSIHSPQVDFSIDNYGAFFLLHPQNDNAREHLTNNVGEEAQWFDGRLVVEPRFIGGLVASLRENGWTV